jgi:formylmethanofuran dehydrogenase subunit E
MDDYDSWKKQSYNPIEVEKQIEEFLDEKYPNPYEQDRCYIECPTCGERLYEGDVYYPDLLLCDSCIRDYQKRVEIE